MSRTTLVEDLADGIKTIRQTASRKDDLAKADLLLAKMTVGLVADRMEEAREEDRPHSYKHQAKGHAIQWLREQVPPDSEEAESKA